MKTRMILAALMASAVVMAMQAPASAVLITDTYLVGDKDDFDNIDGDGIFNLVPGDVVVWYLPGGPPEDGTTDTLMIPREGDVFDFEFSVAARPEVLLSGVLRLTTLDVNWDSPVAWPGQPIKVIKGAEVLLPSHLSVNPVKNTVQLDEIPLTAAALALIAPGGTVHITIGDPQTGLADDWAQIDYAELELTYRDEGGGEEPIPEGSSAMLLVTGLAGLTARRKRRK